MTKDLIDLPIEDLVGLVKREIRYSALSMLRAGRIFQTIKRKLKHREWEPFVLEQKWSWEYVRCCMKLIEVAARFPQAMNLPSGRVVKRILHLPAAQVDQLFTELPAEALEKLTPWDIEKIYNKKKLETPRNSKPKSLPEQVPAVEDVDALVAEAEGMLRQIGELGLKDSSSRGKFEDYRLHLSAAFDRAMYNLGDPDHLKKPWWEQDPMADDISNDLP